MAYRYPKENYIQDRDVVPCAIQPATALQERAQQLAKEFDHLDQMVITLMEKLQPFLLDNAKSEPTARLFAQVGSTDGLCDEAKP